MLLKCGAFASPSWRLICSHSDDLSELIEFDLHLVCNTHDVKLGNGAMVWQPVCICKTAFVVKTAVQQRIGCKFVRDIVYIYVHIYLMPQLYVYLDLQTFCLGYDTGA